MAPDHEGGGHQYRHCLEQQQLLQPGDCGAPSRLHRPLSPRLQVWEQRVRQGDIERPRLLGGLYKESFDGK